MTVGYLPAENAGDAIDTWKVGLLEWRWSARTIITRALRTRTLVLLPTGHQVLVGEGSALTRRGAERAARRAIRHAP